MPAPAAAWAAALAGGCLLARLARLGRDVRRARRDSGRRVAFECVGRDGGPVLLVAGDSLSVGVGAAAPGHTVAGRIAAACPGLTVVNRARCGARAADVADQLERAPGLRWDAVLLTAGGNDVLGRTAPDALRADLHRMLDAAIRLSPRVVVASSANLGAAPIVPWPLNRVLEARTRAVRDRLAEACAARGVEFVDFFRPLSRDPFSRAPELYFGPDGVHPSSACYDLCFRVIERRTRLAGRLACARAPAAGAA